MDFHILTKKQAECLKQIHGRTSVSSFFEPLHTMRELESLELIRRFRDGQFDSGFGYELTSAAMALSPFECGTKYSFVNGGGTIWIHERPVAATPEKLAELQREVKRLNQSNKNLCEALTKADGLISLANNQIHSFEQERASLRRQRDDALAAREEKDAVIARLQNTVNDYVEANRAQAKVIRDQADKLRSLQIHADSLEQRNKIDLQVIKNLEARPAAGNEFRSVWAHEMTDGTYLFRNPRDSVHAKYVVGTCEGIWVKDLDGRPINLNAYTEAMRIGQ